MSMKFDSAVIAVGPLALVQASREHLAALIEGPEAYTKLTGVRVEPEYLRFPGVLERSLERTQTAPRMDSLWWLPYLIVLPSEKTAIGLCGYTGPPDEHDTVEVRCGIAPSRRGQGYTALAAKALALNALRLPGVMAARVWSPAGDGNFARVLEEAGFSRTGEDRDAAGGALWRWERRL